MNYFQKRIIIETSLDNKYLIYVSNINVDEFKTHFSSNELENTVFHLLYSGHMSLNFSSSFHEG